MFCGSFTAESRRTAEVRREWWQTKTPPAPEQSNRQTALVVIMWGQCLIQFIFCCKQRFRLPKTTGISTGFLYWPIISRSEEHTSELQSQSNLVCRLLLEKKKQKLYTN